MTRNYAVRGTSQGRFGNDLGGAVFASQGALTILNSTIAGNENTGAYGGVVYVNVPLDILGSGDPGAFTMRNTIVAHNGVNFDAPAECAVAGGNFTVAGSGNLIMRNATPADDAGSCPGVVSTADRS